MSSGRVICNLIELSLTALLAAVLLLGASSANAQGVCTTAPYAVLAGDVCDPDTGYLPLMPGLPLILPSTGVNGLWTDGEPSIDPSVSGDVDLAVRVGDLSLSSEVPPPAGQGGSSLLSFTAGGGSTGQGVEVPFTLMLTDGPGASAYGSVLSGVELDDRACAVYAFADLDGDGVIGVSNADGSADNEVEKQEAFAHVGRQVGPLWDGRFVSSVGIQVAAPASMGGLVVKLTGGAYTGSDLSIIWSDGTPIFTAWPFFPPLSPGEIIRLNDPNPPNPYGRNMIQFDPQDFFLPAPDHPVLGSPFALSVAGDEPTTDQFISVSGPPVGARLFQEIDYSGFQASSRMLIRPAPSSDGSTRVLVTPADDLSLPGSSVMRLRLLPVDILGNVADINGGRILVKLQATDGLAIVDPDVDGDPFIESVELGGATGVAITLDASSAGVSASLSVSEPTLTARALRFAGARAPTTAMRLLRQAVVRRGSSVDSDRDGIPDDGDGSGINGDRPCTRADLLAGVPCDDNCRLVINPSQYDSDAAGEGNCCDGTCVLDSDTEGCAECPQWKARFRRAIEKARVSIKLREGSRNDVLRVRRLKFTTAAGQTLEPDRESVQLGVLSGDVVHYWVNLPGVLERNGVLNPDYAYSDIDGSIRSVRLANIRSMGSGAYRASLRASGGHLLDSLSGGVTGGVVLYLAIGDDGFTGYLPCREGRRGLRCSILR